MQDEIRRGGHMMGHDRRNSLVGGISIWGVALGCIIGWGAFVMPGTTFLKTAGPVGTTHAICAAAVGMCIVAANYIYLASQLPGEGGAYIYSAKILGQDHAFLAIWSLLMAYISLLWANTTAVALFLRYLCGDLLHFGFHYTFANYEICFGEILVTIVIQIVFAVLVYFGKKVLTVLQVLLAAVLFVAVCILAVGVFRTYGFSMMTTPPFVSEKSHWLQQMDVFMLAPWMFVGFESAMYLMGTVKMKYKSIYGALVSAIFCGMLIYIFLTLIGASYVPGGYSNWTEYIGALDYYAGMEHVPVLYNAYAAMGEPGLALVVIAIMAALFTSIVGFYKAGMRALKQMSDGGVGGTWLKKERNGVPYVALMIILALSIWVPFLGRTAIQWNVDVATVSVSITYEYVAICAFLQARKCHNILHQILGICGMLLSVLYFVVILIPNLFMKDMLGSESYFILSIWCILGILLYWFVFRLDTQNRFGKSTVMWMMLLFLLFLSANMWMRLRMANKFEQRFGKNHVVDKLLIQNNIMQMGLVIFALIVLFSLFAIILQREKSMDKKIIQAEEHNRAKTEFLSHVSHDIRTPMNAIVGYSAMAMDEIGNEEKVREYIRNIQISSGYLLTLLNNVLEMSRIESGRLEIHHAPASIKTILEEIESILQIHLKEKKLTMYTDYQYPFAEYLYLDRLRLNQILMNLCTNAIKYTPEGGEIRMMLEQTQGPIKDGKEYVRCIFSVKDTGIGMAPEFVSKIYEAFERAETEEVSKIQGTGLGMAITKRIVDAFGGEIKLNTRQGVGTQFDVILDFEPVPEEYIRQIKDSHRKVTPTDGQFYGKRVLVADDMETNRKILMAMLRRMGIVAEEATNGIETGQLVKAHEAGYYDAILMDIHMPKMDGYEATSYIRSFEDAGKARVPIVAVTADAFHRDVQKAMQHGMNAHISKPIDYQNIIQVLKKVFEGDNNGEET